jgi:hypothetical protein
MWRGGSSRCASLTRLSPSLTTWRAASYDARGPAMEACPHADRPQSTVLQVHVLEEEGDILVFLCGQDDIESLASLLRKKNTELEQLGAPQVHLHRPHFCRGEGGIGGAWNGGL